jgi:hypothetical protein
MTTTDENKMQMLARHMVKKFGLAVVDPDPGLDDL